MSKKLLFLALFLVFNGITFAQGFNKTYPSVGRNCAGLSENTLTGGYTLFVCNNQDQDKASLLDIDASGTLVSTRSYFAGSCTYFPNTSYSGNFIGPLIDGTFARFIYGGNGLIKYDRFDGTSGTLIAGSSRTIVDTSGATQYFLTGIVEGNWGLLGLKDTYATPSVTNGFRGYFIKISSGGVLTKTSYLGEFLSSSGSAEGRIAYAIPTSDNGLVVDFKLSDLTAVPKETHHFVKINSAGDKVWSVIQNNSFSAQNGIRPTHDGGFVAAFDETTLTPDCEKYTNLVKKWNGQGVNTSSYIVPKKLVSTANPSCPLYEYVTLVGTASAADGGMFMAYRRPLQSDSIYLQKVNLTGGVVWQRAIVYCTVANMYEFSNKALGVCGIKNGQTWAMVTEPIDDYRVGTDETAQPFVCQSLAPNPTEGVLTLTLKSLETRDVTFKITNSLGQIVQIEKQKVVLGLNYLNFDVRSLVSGLYFIVLETGVGRQMGMRFVKE